MLYYPYEDELRTEAWDCDPDALVALDDDMAELDEEEAETDWQVLALDRFGDRLVTGSLQGRGDPTLARCW